MALIGAGLWVAGVAHAARAIDLVPEMEIDRTTIADDWPFTVDRGTLACVAVTATKFVVFSEPWREDVPQEFGNMTLPRSVIVSTNPMAILASFEDRELYLPFDTLETLVVRLAPYERLGLSLCRDDQPNQN